MSVGEGGGGLMAGHFPESFLAKGARSLCETCELKRNKSELNDGVDNLNGR